MANKRNTHRGLVGKALFIRQCSHIISPIRSEHGYVFWLLCSKSEGFFPHCHRCNGPFQSTWIKLPGSVLTALEPPLTILDDAERPKPFAWSPVVEKSGGRTWYRRGPYRVGSMGVGYGKHRAKRFTFVSFQNLQGAVYQPIGSKTRFIRIAQIINRFHSSWLQTLDLPRSFQIFSSVHG